MTVSIGLLALVFVIIGVIFMVINREIGATNWFLLAIAIVVCLEGGILK